jgi:hypothetical protein
MCRIFSDGEGIYAYNTETFGSEGNDIISVNVSKLAMFLDTGHI